MENKLEQVIEVIGNVIFETLPAEDSENDEIREDIDNVLEYLENAYILVQWPESQQYMEEEWFDEEAVLALGAEEKTGSSAYFVPIKNI